MKRSQASPQLGFLPHVKAKDVFRERFAFIFPLAAVDAPDFCAVIENDQYDWLGRLGVVSSDLHKQFFSFPANGVMHSVGVADGSRSPIWHRSF
jgi:hypothetical protein